MKIKPFRPVQGSPVGQKAPVSNAQVEHPVVAKVTVASPQIKPSAENRAKIFSSSDFVSIKETYSQAKTAVDAAKTSAAEVSVEAAGRVFTQEEFVLGWKAFTESQLHDNAQAQMTFKVAQLAVLEGMVVKVVFPSETQLHYFNDLRGALAEFLRNNHEISGVKYEVQTAQQEEVRMPGSFLSEKDKFEQMREKNPAIEELRKRFNLEIPY